MWAWYLPAGAERGGGLAVSRKPADGEGGAGNGVRTRDIQLGRLTLYQLSYSRGGNPSTGSSAPESRRELGFRRTGAERRIRTSVTRCVADLQSAAINHSAISACLSVAPPGACQCFPVDPGNSPRNPCRGSVSGALRGRAFLTGNSKDITHPEEPQGETSGLAHACRRARTRKSVTAAAAETFRLSMPPGMGMNSRPSQRSRILRCRPSPSAPITRTVARSKGSAR